VRLPRNKQINPTSKRELGPSRKNRSHVSVFETDERRGNPTLEAREEGNEKLVGRAGVLEVVWPGNHRW